MDFPLKRVAWYVDTNIVRSGHLVQVTEPSEEDRKNGATTLYEFGHGFATPDVYKSEEDAQEALNKRDAGVTAPAPPASLAEPEEPRQESGK